MAMMLQASCTVARPSIVSLVSSFKGLSLKSSSPSVSFSSPQVQPACRRLVLQPVAAAGYKLKSHKVRARVCRIEIVLNEFTAGKVSRATVLSFLPFFKELAVFGGILVVSTP